MARRIPRWLARLPIPVFRRGWGAIMGSRMAMLEHRGRVSGQPRHVVLEVLERTPDHLIVVSGYGVRSQWYRNILADPSVRVWSGRATGVPGAAARLPTEEAWHILTDYRTKHLRAARALGRMLDIPELADSRPLPPDLPERLILVRIALRPAA